MPTYLRWIAAMTAGLSAYFTYSIATFGIARANGVSELRGAAGALLAFGAWIITMVVVLGINDWLNRRYPRARPPVRTDGAVPEALPAEDAGRASVSE